MTDSSLSPWARVLSSLITRFGELKTAAMCYALLLGVSLILSSMFYYVALGEVNLVDILAVVFFTAVVSPFMISILLNSIRQLDASYAYLDSATKQEKLLNQTLKDNINRLNIEIDERKMAFHAKHRAIEELRREIAERKKTQQELAQQGMLLRSIVDSSPDLFYYRDNNGVFAGCNKMFEEVMGKTSAELIGKTVEQIFPSYFLAEVLRTDKQVEQTHQALTIDVEYMVNGENRWFELRKLPFINDQGDYIGLLAFGRDITSRKEAAQALETAYKDKGKFIATLSHELRTPLNGIVGLTRMLLDTELNKQQRSWCNTVFSSAETLGNIFNDIIDLDKIDREQLDIATDSINVSDFINDVVNFAGLIAEQKELEFSIERNGTLDVYALLDPTRLRQVVWNLINNAVKFTQHGEVKLTCSREERNDGPWLELKISDTGQGIPEDQLSRIFDMYYKAPDLSGKNAIGSGIGLAVTKALVSAMKGTISVTSTEGEGSCFTVHIPLSLCVAPTEQSYAGRGLYILLVEDVPLNAEIATNLLEQRGHEVIWAETGEDALSFVETEDELDLVLLDMQLPDINGDEVARQIRADSHFDKLPIVALTANVRSAEEDLEGISVQGALAKPINTIKLDKMLADLFDIQQNESDKPLLTVSKEALEGINAGVLDVETIEDFVNSMGLEVFKRSSGLFEKLNPQYQQELQSALNENDREEYKSVAHKLKGAAGSVGLNDVQLHAKKMEHGALDESDEVLREWLDTLADKINEGQIALHSFLQLLE
ncbi:MULTISPECIES: aerobic respiration two-component sensor histidine kinase ArcB [unclassified Pseudoalteromonas]|uniref:aerobic respiration two-component sensor histidine kinase ArcB n=1 Tax=unclassified Pseudoalteromonas TaxID=194690 RepID=UPI000B6ED718|nr:MULTISPECIES: aerobic respiration two-component sensor histidine kinase ArcB [unclassified Pseudoalteromonas]MAJ39397.1 aerobic respiration two-component sensor histidine kinase ArcB [Pseudoalteromonadaceae bacterium]OUX90749.1 MAG: aerobic respiration two-component sensor histidine kinase ArcB [Pseudoalteromonas sp. TMED43]MDC9565994.1 aerobic respiration two-component sensor histidine kinase ArcB [Pseudoalteromonas sp. GAB2316C]MDC9570327.1 aerobic respiration two-component sensor histidin